jgi:streptogramin lyase
MSRLLIVWVLALCSLIVLGPLLYRPVTAAAQRAGDSLTPASVMTGTVKSVSGEAMEGVLVSARAADRTFTTTVFTDRAGRFTFPRLAPGQYRIWAQAVGYGTTRTEMRAEGGREQSYAFKLSPIEDFTMQLSGAEWMAALPEDTPAHRRMKQIFQTTCTACHGAHVTLRNRFDEAGWRAIINVMAYANAPGTNLARTEGRQPQAILNHYSGELAPYLAEMRGPGISPMNFQRLPRPTGEATRVVITEYDSIVPSQRLDPRIEQGGHDWSEGPPSTFQGGGAHDVVADLNGNAWATDNTDNRNRSFFKVDHKTGKITDFKVAGATGLARGTHGLGIVVPSTGLVWMNLYAGPDRDGAGVLGSERPRAEEGRGSLLKIDPRDDSYEIFAPPQGMSNVGSHLEPDGKGKIWSGTNRGLLRFDPDTKQFTEYKSRFLETTRFVGTYGASGDMDGNGWVAIISHDKLAVADVKTATVKEISIPPNKVGIDIATPEDRAFFAKFEGATTLGSNAAAPWAQSPRRIGGDLTAPTMWVCLWNGQALAEVDIRTHQIKYHPAPIAHSGVYDVDVDNDHAAWVSLRNADRVAKLDPKTGRWTVYVLPTLGTEARHISVDRRTGDVWLAGRRGARLVRLHFPER